MSATARPSRDSWLAAPAPIDVVTTLLALAGFVLAGWTWASARRVLYPPRRFAPPPSGQTPAHSTHRLRAPDGAGFDIWLLEAPGPARGRILLCHGYYATRLQVLEIADELRRRGFESLVMELRGHGDRPGPCTLGVREADDALAALAWARSRPGAAEMRTGVLGFSMGAAVMCQAAVRDTGIAAVVADSPYGRFFPALRMSLRDAYPWAGAFAAWLTWLGVQLALGRRLAPLDPTALAPQLRQPLFIIQGGGDRRVPATLGQELVDAWAGPKERWFEPDLAHVGMFLCHPDEYHRRVAEFFTRTLG